MTARRPKNLPPFWRRRNWIRWQKPSESARIIIHRSVNWHHREVTLRMWENIRNSLQMMRILQIHLLLSKMISPGWMAAGHPSAVVDRQSKLTEKHTQSLFIRERFRKAEREIISLPESVVTVQDMREKYILVTSVFKKAVKKKK